MLQKSDATSAESSCEHGEVPLNELLGKVEFEVLEKDLSELIHILHFAERPTVKEVIQMDIELILVKIDSLKFILKEQLETKVSLPEVLTMKCKKYNCKEQNVEDPFPVISNHTNLLYNDSKSEDTPITV